MDSKTKDALKQLQTEVRHLQALMTASAAEPAGGGAPPRREKNEAKDKSDLVVEYAVQHRLPGAETFTLKTDLQSYTGAQLGVVTDEAAALIGYALSSPQKVALLRALLPKESESAAALGEAAHLSTGSLYHHLRDLSHAGLISQAARNRYLLTDRGRRVLLVVLALAAEK